MGVPGNANALLLKQAAAAGGYQIQRSLRFNSSDSAYLSRTPGTAGNRTTWTYSCWLKRSKLGAPESVFIAGETYAGGSGDTWATGAMFGTDDKLNIYWRSSSSPLATTAAVYRDCSAWYHIVLTANSTTLKAYVNGSEVASGSISGNGAVNSTLIHLIGVAGTTTYFAYANQMLAECHFIDGQALTPSSFTEVSATTGQLIPLAYSGSYGTNGFKLKFSDNSAATAAALGNDYSGNNNDWTPNNLSVTAGAGNDSLVDTPTSISATDTGVGGEIRGNYCTWNPLFTQLGVSVPTNGNLDSPSNAGSITTRNTIGVTAGKWYAEFVSSTGAYPRIGVTDINETNNNMQGSSTITWGGNNGAGSGEVYVNGSQTGYTQSTYIAGDLIGIAYDAGTRQVWFSKNGTWQNFAGSGANPATGTNPVATLGGSGAVFFGVRAETTVITANWGQRPFAYTAPSGFKALCDTNLGAPVVAKPNEVMDVKLYTGNGSARSITGLGFSPDFVWIKNRSSATGHRLLDTVRGATKALISQGTDAEITESQGLTAFNSDGFSLGTGAFDYNQSSDTYVAWTWDAGTSTVTNTQGSISSQVRANASAGFSVVTWTGTGANATVGHGLGVAPTLFIVKRRDSAANWIAHTTAIDGSYDYLYLNLTNAKADSGLSAPTSTIFQVGNGLEMNGSGATYVGYCFAPVSGYSSFGSYTGNGSTDGPFVFCNFRPRWLLIKNTTGTNNWELYDAARDTYNVVGKVLLPNTSDAEITNAGATPGVRFDLLSNGFKVRDSQGSVNGSGNTIIYAAFAESPFQYARAR